MITNETLSDIREYSPQNFLITTLYLQIDGAPQQSHLIALKDLIKQRKGELDNQNLRPEIASSISDDFKRISDFINFEFSRQGTRTLAIFSCSAVKYWHILPLQLPLRNSLAVGNGPYLLPLNMVLEEYDRFLVILIERAKARLFEVFAGEIREHSSILDEVPRKVKVGGFGGAEERRIARHIEDLVRRHYKNVSDAAYELHKKYSFNYVILCGNDQNSKEFPHYLHNSLQEHVVTCAAEEFGASLKEIQERVLPAIREIKQKQEQKVLKRLFDQVNSGGLGIVGIDSTIRALQQGQVNSLVVREGYTKNGFRCENCRSLLTERGECDYCGGSTHPVMDLVDEAVQEALHQGCQVKWITSANMQLETAGKIGAILRFKI
ncbi:MAG: hypothetical protein C5B54_06945 [Acidobacteria bacterium]|nr:MAG: hypothetical protein C5B54_06945 [Acidobacteriota bacterium]